MVENARDAPARRAGWAPADLLGAATAVLLPLLFATPFRLASWTPRYLALPVLAAGGLVFLPRLLRGATRRTAVLASLFGLWALAGTLAAPTKAVAFWGRYAIGTGLLFVLALIGAWAVGAKVATAPPAPSRLPGTTLVERALVVAAVVNAVVAMLQQVVDLSAYGLATLSGRSAGLYGNPVYLAELLAGGLWLAVTRLDRPRTTRSAWALVVVMAAGIDLSGSRFGLGLAALAALMAIPRLRWRQAALAAALIAVGVGVGTGIAAAGRHPGTTGLARTEAAPESGVRPRLETWRAGVSATARRPILGWGPSGFLAATSSRRTLALARTEGPDKIFADAHDIVVEYAVTTGIPGVLLLLGWCGSAFADTRRRARRSFVQRWQELPPLGGFALFVFGLSLVEPLHVGVTPLAFLALGASATRPTEEASAPRLPLGKAGAAILVVIAVATSAVLGTGLALMRRADEHHSPWVAITASHLLPAWSEPARVVGAAYANRAVFQHDAAARASAIRWWTTAAHRDPDDPGPWASLGGVLATAGRYDEAHSALLHALQRNPWSQQALDELIIVDRALGRNSDADELSRRRALMNAGG